MHIPLSPKFEYISKALNLSINIITLKQILINTYICYIKNLFTYLKQLSYIPKASLSQMRNVTGLQLLKRYFPGKCSHEIQSLIPPGLTFRSRNSYAIPIVARPRHYLCIPLMRYSSHSHNFFPRYHQFVISIYQNNFG